MLNPVTNLLFEILQLYFYVVMAWAILSMLISFNVVNRYQPAIAKIFQILEQLVEPALRPIRRFLPTLGGIDLSPLVLILLIQFVQRTLVYVSVRNLF